MRVKTARFGTLEVDAVSLIAFSNGLIGFPDARSFVLIESSGGNPFQWLQSVTEPSLAFLVAEPTRFYPEFAGRVRREYPLVDGASEAQLLLIIVTVDRVRRSVTANLAAPLVLQTVRREGAQLLLSGEDVHPRHDLLADYRRSMTQAARGDLMSCWS